MATSRATVEDLLSRVGGDPATARPMFGEYCVYWNGRPVALLCDDRLFLKITAAGRELAPRAGEGVPYPGAKPHLELPPEAWDDAPLAELLAATADALPPPKPRRKG